MSWEIIVLLVLTILIALFVVFSTLLARAARRSGRYAPDQGYSILVLLIWLTILSLQWMGLGMAWLIKLEDPWIFWKLFPMLPVTYLVLGFSRWANENEPPQMKLAVTAVAIAMVIACIVGWWAVPFWKVMSLCLLHIPARGITYLIKNSNQLWHFLLGPGQHTTQPVAMSIAHDNNLG